MKVFKFPPKKVFGKTSPAFVAARQSQLAVYMAAVLPFFVALMQLLACFEKSVDVGSRCDVPCTPQVERHVGLLSLSRQMTSLFEHKVTRSQERFHTSFPLFALQ